MAQPILFEVVEEAHLPVLTEAAREKLFELRHVVGHLHQRQNLTNLTLQLLDAVALIQVLMETSL
jgi:hypothetical protein